MHLDNLDNIEKISKSTNFVIFELPKNSDFSAFFPHSLHIRAEDGDSKSKNTITITQIRNIEGIINAKHDEDFFVVVENAELANESAINCFLKNLEEPKPKVHIIFLVHNWSELLPTVLSRAHVYYISKEESVKAAPNIDENRLAAAKTYLSANQKQLIEIADKINKDKKDTRKKAIQLVDDAIEVCYRAYYMTGNATYLTKLENLIKASRGLRANGNIKLQLIAYML